MEQFSLYTAGLGLVFNVQTLFSIAAGVFLGIVFGGLPGLNANMGVAILIPFTYAMNPVQAIATLSGIYLGAVYAGSISATLINIPGTPAAVMTVFDGYPMAQRGEAGRAISLTTTVSFLGGLFSVIVLVTMAPVIAKFASGFRSQEYFAVAALGLSVIAYISGSSVLKGVVSALIGLLVAMVGVDLVSGYPRFTFGVPDLLTGVDFVAVMIGIFGLSEILVQLSEGFQKYQVTQRLKGLLPSLDDLRRVWAIILRSSVIGVLIGAIPGAGATIASIVAYGQQKRLSKDPEMMGKGSIEGIAAAESANNACTGGAMITMLSLGIPGDSVTAILIGAFMLHGIRPGPLLFSEHTSLVSAIFISLVVANVFMLLMGLAGAPFFARMLLIPRHILYPVISLLCVVGTYALRNNPFDVLVMLFFGFLGFLFNRVGIPRAPLVLGLILEPLMEQNLRRALQLNRDNVWLTVQSFIERPIALITLLITIGLLLMPMVQDYFKRRKEAKIGAVA